MSEKKRSRKTTTQQQFTTQDLEKKLQDKAIALNREIKILQERRDHLKTEIRSAVESAVTEKKADLRNGS